MFRGKEMLRNQVFRTIKTYYLMQNKKNLKRLPLETKNTLQVENRSLGF